MNTWMAHDIELIMIKFASLTNIAHIIQVLNDS